MALIRVNGVAEELAGPGFLPLWTSHNAYYVLQQVRRHADMGQDPSPPVGSMLAAAMHAFRRRRLRARLSLLAMVVLLWSQLAFAAHPGCLAVADQAPVATTAMPGCAHEAPPPEEPVCQSHCSQGDLSSDVARVPPVPPLPAMLALSWTTVVLHPRSARQQVTDLEGPPPVSWHRPTAHPAALLLI